MPIHGPFFPDTVTNTDVGIGIWSNLNNVKADDGVTANTTIVIFEDFTRKLTATNFGFAIPFNEIIVGTEYTSQGFSTPLQSFQQSAGIIKNGVIVGNPLGNADSNFRSASPGSTFTSGGPTDTLGVLLTPNDANNMNFGFFLQGFNDVGADSIFEVDFMTIKIFTIIRPTLRNRQTRGIRRRIQSIV